MSCAVIDNRAFFAEDGVVRAFDLPTGEEIWEEDYLGDFSACSTRGCPLLVLEGSGLEGVVVVDPKDGAILARFPDLRRFFPCGLERGIGYDGYLHDCGIKDSQVLDQIGEERFKLVRFAVELNDEAIAFGTIGGHLVGLNRRTGERIWNYSLDAVLEARIETDGLIVLGERGVSVVVHRLCPTSGVVLEQRQAGVAGSVWLCSDLQSVLRSDGDEIRRLSLLTLG